MTPSELLTKAADIVESWATDASPGSWEYNWAFATAFVCDGKAPFEKAVAQTAIVRSADGIPNTTKAANTQWIALMSPAIAPLLMAWMREEATACGLRPTDPSVALARHIVEHAEGGE